MWPRGLHSVRIDRCGRAAADEKIEFPVGAGRNVTMSRWIKKGVEFINALADQWKGSSDPSPANEKMDTVLNVSSSNDTMPLSSCKR
jgi:hypothetical protein